MSSTSSNPWTRSSKKCKWQKVRRRSLSLSEWKCDTCHETGFSDHRKPPTNCVANATRSGSPVKKYSTVPSRTTEQSHALRFLLVAFMILTVGYAAYERFGCGISQLLGIESGICSSADHISRLEERFGREYTATEAITEFCDGTSSVDYFDAASYLEQATDLIVRVDNILQSRMPPDRKNIEAITETNRRLINFYNDHIAEKCFRGERGPELAQEITRANNFLEEKLNELYAKQW